GRAQDLIGDLARVERRVAQALDDLVLHLELVRDARAEALLVPDLVDLDAVARDLVGVRGPDAHAGGPELLAPALALVETVEERVPRHEQVRAIRDAQVRGRDAVAFEVRELLAEHPEVDDRPRPDDAERLRIEDARRDEMQLERPVLVHDGVPGVVATLVSDDDIRLLRE